MMEEFCKMLPKVVSRLSQISIAVVISISVHCSIATYNCSINDFELLLVPSRY